MFPDDKTLHQAIFRALRFALCLTAKEADIHLTRAYADEPAQEPPSSANRCYYFLQTDPSARPLRETEVIDSVPVVSVFLPCRLALVFYGPDCESWAHRCLSFLFLDGADHPRGLLRACGLYLVPSPPPPSIIYEETGGKYRKRADAVIDARLLENSSYGSPINLEPVPVDTISVAPSVQIHQSV